MAVGRYQHAHAASTYSYTLALSRSPSPSSLPYSFLQPSYPLRSFHRFMFLSCPPLMCSLFFSFAPIITLPFISFSLFLSFCLLHPLLFSSFSPKYDLPSFLFSYFQPRFQLLYLLLLKIDFSDFLYCQFSLRVLFVIFISIYGATVIISLPQCIYTKQKSRSISLFYICFFLSCFTSFLLRASFPRPLFTFSLTSHHYISFILLSHIRCYLFMSSFFTKL